MPNFKHAASRRQLKNSSSSSGGKDNKWTPVPWQGGWDGSIVQSHTKLCWAAALTGQLKAIFTCEWPGQGSAHRSHKHSLSSVIGAGSSEIIVSTSVWKNNLNKFCCVPLLPDFWTVLCTFAPPCFPGDDQSQDCSFGGMTQSVRRPQFSLQQP